MCQLRGGRPHSAVVSESQGPQEERKCHGYGKPGHIAARCPERDKAKVAEDEPSPTRTDRLLMVTDDEGFTPHTKKATDAQRTHVGADPGDL